MTPTVIKINWIKYFNYSNHQANRFQILFVGLCLAMKKLLEGRDESLESVLNEKTDRFKWKPVMRKKSLKNALKINNN